QCEEFFVSGRRRHTRFSRDWSSDVCSSDLQVAREPDGVFKPCADVNVRGTCSRAEFSNPSENRLTQPATSPMQSKVCRALRARSRGRLTVPLLTAFAPRAGLSVRWSRSSRRSEAEQDPTRTASRRPKRSEASPAQREVVSDARVCPQPCADIDCRGVRSGARTGSRSEPQADAERGQRQVVRDIKVSPQPRADLNACDRVRRQVSSEARNLIA